jgi:hypothetical protein
MLNYSVVTAAEAMELVANVKITSAHIECPFVLHSSYLPPGKPPCVFEARQSCPTVPYLTSEHSLLFVRKRSANLQTFRRQSNCHLRIFIGPLPTAIVNVQGTVFPIENDLTSLPNQKWGRRPMGII